MRSKARTLWAHIKAHKSTLFFLSSIFLPITITYLLEPNSFQYAWKGRAPYLFFLWILALELAMARKQLFQNTNTTSNQKNLSSDRESTKTPGQDRLKKKTKNLATLLVILIPTAYIIATLMLNQNTKVIELGRLLGVPSGPRREEFLLVYWPLSVEYFVFAACFIATMWLIYGNKGLKLSPIAFTFLLGTGIAYTIDTFYPYETFKALQAFVPVTTSVTAYVLNWMGYETKIFIIYDGLQLWVKGNQWQAFAIFWPCAGISSLIIFSLAILLFIKEANFSTRQKILLFVIGAAGTFFVNILRLVTIVLISIQSGANAGQAFHANYGELFFVIWIVIYLGAISSVRILKKPKT